MSTSTTDDSWSDQKIIFILAALMFFAIPIRIPDPETQMQKQFRNFIIQFNRTYHGNASEYEKRYQIFKNTFEMLDDYDHDNRPVFGINRFSDMSQREFNQRYLLAESPNDISRLKRNFSAALYRYNRNNFGKGATALPERVDWRKRGVITPIRSQGTCGSCYAQSVIGGVEAMYALKSNSSSASELSVQQMIDCAANANFGCIGGDTCNLLEWLKDENITIVPKGHYPGSVRYKACHMATAVQHLPPTVHGVRVTDYTCASFVGHELEMLAFLAFKGPLIASVNALSWKQYVGGVIKTNCYGPPNHAVQIVGYELGATEEPHFIVRNSWGTGFGHRGYAKIAIGANVCGIAEEVSSVTVD